LDAHSGLHMKNNKLFSPQQLVDCVPNPRECGGSGGCEGATVELAMAYVAMIGLDGSDKVPYKHRGGQCQKPVPSGAASSFLEMAHDDALRPHHRQSHHQHHHSEKELYPHMFDSLIAPRLAPDTGMSGGASIGLQSWLTLQSNKARPLMSAVMNGPVAISVGASDWHSYQDGVFDGCSKDAVIDHAVTLFGYGQEPCGTKYWNIRNSWGTAWGEKGFIRLLRMNSDKEDDAHCGIDHDPAKGIECKPYPDQVKVCGMCGLLYDSVAVKFNNATQAFTAARL